ncbi:hypothetical protein [Glycomyces harbinensis]|uniref:hypothetical protein n=1 Tax=Glycomyces harbinensis TaxID=58114 RepID=UPI0024DE6B7E|nr:hypothetical protein [Glycomyces harbinensis]
MSTTRSATATALPRPAGPRTSASNSTPTGQVPDAIRVHFAEAAAGRRSARCSGALAAVMR